MDTKSKIIDLEGLKVFRDNLNIEIDEKLADIGGGEVTEESIIDALGYTPANVNALPTETTVEGWGFTKNTGDYSKPDGGIPKTDLASDVQTSLNKADTALQSFTEADPTVPVHVKSITEENISDWNDKQDKLVAGDNIVIDPDTNIISAAGGDLSYYEQSGFLSKNMLSVPYVEPSGTKKYGVTFTYGIDGAIKANGLADGGTPYLILSDGIKLVPDQKYTLFLKAPAVDHVTLNIYFKDADGNNLNATISAIYPNGKTINGEVSSVSTYYASAYCEYVTFSVSEEVYIQARINVGRNYFWNLEMSPSLAKGEESVYMPYAKSNLELGIEKQDKLVAGDNITINGNVISATASSSIDVIDSLESESKDDALSANQGKILSENINNKQDSLTPGKAITINEDNVIDVKRWVGTKAEYQAQKNQIPDGTIVNITDDADSTSGSGSSGGGSNNGGGGSNYTVDTLFTGSTNSGTITLSENLDSYHEIAFRGKSGDNTNEDYHSIPVSIFKSMEKSNGYALVFYYNQYMYLKYVDETTIRIVNKAGNWMLVNVYGIHY